MTNGRSGGFSFLTPQPDPRLSSEIRDANDFAKSSANELFKLQSSTESIHKRSAEYGLYEECVHDHACRYFWEEALAGGSSKANGRWVRRSLPCNRAWTSSVWPSRDRRPFCPALLSGVSSLSFPQLPWARSFYVHPSHHPWFLLLTHHLTTFTTFNTFAVSSGPSLYAPRVATPSFLILFLYLPNVRFSEF